MDGPSLCSLCGLALQGSRIVESQRSFCCPGCHAVYNILAAKGVLQNYLEHPIFQQAVKIGLISNPHLLSDINNKKEDAGKDNELLYLEIGAMWCPSCAQVLQWVIEREKGIRKCQVDYSTDFACIEYSPRQISKESIFDAIRSLGYEPGHIQDAQSPPISKTLMLQFSVAAFCALNLMMFATPLYASYLNEDAQGLSNLFAWVSLFTALPVMFYSAAPIFKRCWTTLSLGILSMETLVAIGVLSAFGMSMSELLNGGNQVYFDSMAAIVAFMLLGKIIESKAKFSSKSAIFRILRSLPKRGRKRYPDGSEENVDIKEIGLGDTLVALTGEKIVLDGIVVEGSGCCDESLLTGEPIPVLKNCGDRILAGAVLQHGRLVYIVKTTPEQSTLQKIVSLVGQEIAQKSSYVRVPDLIVQGFVPFILLTAIATAAYCLWFGLEDPGLSNAQTALQRAVAILLISCPCAIGIAAPIAESRLIHAMAERGAIVRNRGALRYLGQETVMLFDKTGTLTTGSFQLVEGLQTIPPDQWPLLKALASSSIHPLSKAVKDAVPGPCEVFDCIEEIPGQGLVGSIGPETKLLGSQAFLESYRCVCPNACLSEHSISTNIYYGSPGGIAYPLALGDKLRKSVADMVAALAPLPLMLISGDGPHTTAKVAELCRIINWRARCSPDEKKKIVAQLRQEGNIVAMVGDGINDAPALTAAHIGISAVSAADMSIHVSDILLTTDSLQAIPEIRKLACKGRRIIHQNIFWAFFYNSAGIIWAATGALTPLIAAFAMIASSLFVIGNARRI